MVDKGFEFLGCDVRPGMITPNKKSRRRLLASVSNVLDTSVASMNDPEKLVADGRTFIDSLSEVSNIVHGWGNQYSTATIAWCFVNLMSRLIRTINSYLSAYSEARRRLNPSRHPEDARRLLGIHLLADSKSDPIACS